MCPETVTPVASRSAKRGPDLLDRIVRALYVRTEACAADLANDLGPDASVTQVEAAIEELVAEGLVQVARKGSVQPTTEEDALLRVWTLTR